MRFVVAATLLAAAATSAAAFTVHQNPTQQLLSSSTLLLKQQSTTSKFALHASTTKEEEATACEVSEDAVPLADLSKQKGSASLLRSSVLTDVNGDFVSLGGMMGNQKSVVVFLRHMG